MSRVETIGACERKVVRDALHEALTTKGRLPFSREFKQDAPGLWDYAAEKAIEALDDIRAKLKAERSREQFTCPINHYGCTRVCGSYGCGG